MSLGISRNLNLLNRNYLELEPSQADLSYEPVGTGTELKDESKGTCFQRMERQMEKNNEIRAEIFEEQKRGTKRSGIV